MVILYTDDTVVFANTEEELTSILSTFNDYCNIWKLDINFNKTKIIVFGDKFNRQRNINISNHQIEVLDTFKYLDIIFSKNRKILTAKKYIAEQARTASSHCNNWNSSS